MAWRKPGIIVHIASIPADAASICPLYDLAPSPALSAGRLGVPQRPFSLDNSAKFVLTMTGNRLFEILMLDDFKRS